MEKLVVVGVGGLRWSVGVRGGVGLTKEISFVRATLTLASCFDCYCYVLA